MSEWCEEFGEMGLKICQKREKWGGSWEGGLAGWRQIGSCHGEEIKIWSLGCLGSTAVWLKMSAEASEARDVSQDASFA